MIRPAHKLLRKRLLRRLIDSAIQAGATTAQARDAANRVLPPETNGINWDWFLSGGFAQLLEALLLILRLFQGAPRTEE